MGNAELEEEEEKRREGKARETTQRVETNYPWEVEGKYGVKCGVFLERHTYRNTMGLG